MHRPLKPRHLSQNGKFIDTWQQLTTIKTDFTPEAKTTLYVAAGILAAGAIVTALIISKNK